MAARLSTRRRRDRFDRRYRRVWSDARLREQLGARASACAPRTYMEALCEQMVEVSKRRWDLLARGRRSSI